jgi:hypothetical protein
MYFDMNKLRKKAGWVRFAKRGKKQGIKHQNTAPGGRFYAEMKLVCGMVWRRMRAKRGGEHASQRRGYTTAGA